MRLNERIRFAFAVMSLGLVTQHGQAQPVPGIGPVGGGQPAYSPYLNLLRPGSTLLNNQGLVQPQLQTLQSLQNLQNGITANGVAIGNVQDQQNSLPGTGHQTQFLNYRVYFLNNSGQQSTSGGRGGAQFGNQFGVQGGFGGQGGSGITTGIRRQ